MTKSVSVYYSKSRHHSAQGGFTILEMAVVVIVSGILLAFLGSALLTFLKESQIRTTEHRLEKIGEAIDRYLSVNGRYPCPASRFLGGANENFGRDVCMIPSAPMAGTVRTGNLHVGAVPTRTLNLPDEFLADAWGRKFTYAVSRDLTSATTYRADLGIIRIEGVSGTVLTNEGHYAVVSHGMSGDGAFSLSASNNRYIPCISTPRDAENCDDDRIFISMLVNSEPNLADFYDDYVYYRGLKAPLTYPAGAVMSFNLPSCPDGWIDFVPAQGHMIAGFLDDPTTGGIISFDQEIMRIDTATPTSTINFIHGRVRGDDEVSFETNTPRFVSLTYCEKLPR